MLKFQYPQLLNIERFERKKKKRMGRVIECMGLDGQKEQQERNIRTR